MAISSKQWKALGVAGVAGVAATGIVLARDERQRRAYSADDVRARLHERADALPAEPELIPPPEARSWRPWSGRRRWRRAARPR